MWYHNLDLTPLNKICRELFPYILYTVQTLWRSGYGVRLSTGRSWVPSPRWERSLDRLQRHHDCTSSTQETDSRYVHSRVKAIIFWYLLCIQIQTFNTSQTIQFCKWNYKKNITLFTKGKPLLCFSCFGHSIYNNSVTHWTESKITFQ